MTVRMVKAMRNLIGGLRNDDGGGRLLSETSLFVNCVCVCARARACVFVCEELRPLFYNLRLEFWTKWLPENDVFVQRLISAKSLINLFI